MRKLFKLFTVVCAISIGIMAQSPRPPVPENVAPNDEYYQNTCALNTLENNGETTVMEIWFNDVDHLDHCVSDQWYVQFTFEDGGITGYESSSFGSNPPQAIDFGNYQCCDVLVNAIECDFEIDNDGNVLVSCTPSPTN